MSLTLGLGLAIRHPSGTFAAVPPNTPGLPVNVAPPVITGMAQEGQTLAADTGTWTNSPTGHAYQWRRGGVAIGGATGGTYTLVAADVGSTITVQVTASNAAGAGVPASSAATATVTAAGGPVSALTITAHDYDTITFDVPTGTTALTLDGVSVIGGVVAGSYVAPRIEGAQQDLVATHPGGTSTAKVHEKALVVAYLGQSNINYGLNPTTNSNGYTKPPIVTQNARILDYKAAALLDVTQANSLAGDVNVGVANMSVWLNYVAPGKKIIFVTMAESGTPFRNLMRENDSPAVDGIAYREWAPTADAAAHVEANHAPVDLVVEWWYTGVNSQIENKLNSHLPGYVKQLADGSPFTLGNLHGGLPMDHTLWDITAPLYEKGEGIFSRGWTKWTFIRNHSKDTTQGVYDGIDAFWNDPRIQVFAASQGTWGGHYANDSAHAIQNDPDGQIALSWSMAIPVARALGVTINEPEYVGHEVDPDGLWVDILVSLPNGGTLTTQRILEGRAPAVGARSWQQPVSGLEIERFGSGLARSPIHRLGETVFDLMLSSRPAPVFSELLRGTVEVSDTGSGSPRRGRIRFTPETGFPLVNGDRIVPNHLYGPTEGPYPQTYDVALGLTNKIWLDYPIEHVPALHDAAAPYPFPGVPVKPFGPLQTIGGVNAAPYVFVPQSVVLTASNGRLQSPMPATLTPTNEGIISFWWKNADPAWPINRTIFQVRKGSTVAGEISTRSSGRLNASFSNGFTNPAAGAFTQGIWQHVLLSWRAGPGGFAHYCVNGAAPLVGPGWALASGMAFTRGFDRIGFGTESGGTTGITGELGHFYMNLSASLDLTNPANRAKFISGNDPVSLGASGQLPTGATPAFYFDGVGAAWDNLGTYGAVPVNGTLTAGTAPLLGS